MQKWNSSTEIWRLSSLFKSYDWHAGKLTEWLEFIFINFLFIWSLFRSDYLELNSRVISGLALVQRLQSAKSQIQSTCITHSTAERHWEDCSFVGEYSEVPWIYMQICNECRKSFFYLRDSVSLQKSLLKQKQRWILFTLLYISGLHL